MVSYSVLVGTILISGFTAHFWNEVVRSSLMLGIGHLSFSSVGRRFGDLSA